MKIGKATIPESAICTYDDETIVAAPTCATTRSARRRLVDYFHPFVTGRRLRRRGMSRVLDATLVAIAEHGLVPSVQGEPHDAAAAPEALQARWLQASPVAGR